VVINKKNLKFVRYGGLSPIVQKGYDPKMPYFHSPPTNNGFFAFVQGFEERFLLGSECFIPHRMEWIKDKNGNRINHRHPDYDQISDKYTGYKDKKRPDLDVEQAQDYIFLCKHKKGKIFTHTGDIWHHLSSLPHRFKEAKGAWFLSNYDDYVELLIKELHAMKKYKNQNNGISYSIDHLEIFISR
jgi:hypothetical protein